MSQTLKTGGTGLEHKVLEALKEKIDVYGDDSEIRSEETPWGTVEILTAEFIPISVWLRFRSISVSQD